MPALQLMTLETSQMMMMMLLMMMLMAPKEVRMKSNPIRRFGLAHACIVAQPAMM